jgi:hypothetical protein
MTLNPRKVKTSPPIPLVAYRSMMTVVAAWYLMSAFTPPLDAAFWPVPFTNFLKISAAVVLLVYVWWPGRERIRFWVVGYLIVVGAVRVSGLVNIGLGDEATWADLAFWLMTWLAITVVASFSAIFGWVVDPKSNGNGHHS